MEFWFEGLLYVLEDSEGNLLLLLIGGNKNSQAKDITEAKNIVKKAITKIEKKAKMQPIKKATEKATKKKR